MCDKIITKMRRDLILLHTESEGAEEDSEDEQSEEESMREGLCLICGRNMPLTFHHLIPKRTHTRMLKSGYNKLFLNTHGVDLCRPCHSHIHKLIPLNDMADTFNTLEVILSHPGVQKWIPYIRKQKLTSRCDRRLRQQERNLTLPDEVSSDEDEGFLLL